MKLEEFATVIAFLFLGIAARRSEAFPRDSGATLSAFVIYLSLPALVLLKVPELRVSSKTLVPALLPWVMLAFSAAAVWVVSGLFKLERATKGCLLLLVPLGNTSFLGIPMVRAFFGEGAVAYALLYDQLGSFLALATYGSLVLSVYGTKAEKPTLKGTLKKVLTFPPFVALVVAAGLKGTPYPSLVLKVLEPLASALVPVIMVAVGFQLTLKLKKGEVFRVGLGLFLKMVLAPLAAILFCKVLGLSGEPVRVAVFEAGMPPMVSAGALAIAAGIAPELAAALVGLGIASSLLTLPILYELTTSLL